MLICQIFSLKTLDMFVTKNYFMLIMMNNDSGWLEYIYMLMKVYLLAYWSKEYVEIINYAHLVSELACGTQKSISSLNIDLDKSA